MTGHVHRHAWRFVALRVALARAALAWERLWPAIWPTCGVCGTFLGLSLFGVWAHVPGWFHLIVLVGFVAAAGFAAWRGLARFRAPSDFEARRRIERTSNLDHRPLTTFDDRLVIGGDDGSTRSLWRIHRHRMRGSLRAMRVDWPSPGLAARDPQGFRAAVGLLLVAGMFAAGDDWQARIGDAMTPAVGGPPPEPARLEAWIAPPPYTRLAPILLTQAPPENGTAENGTAENRASGVAAIPVPRGSEILAKVTGGRGIPSLRLDDIDTPFEPVDATSHQIRVPVDDVRRIRIVQPPSVLADWQVAIIPDAPPSAAFERPPVPSQRQALRIDYSASDDYGVAQVFLDISRPGTDTADTIELALPSQRPRSASETDYRDLTPHRWAGLEVILAIRAIDEIGQSGSSEPVTVVLPEREFHHPVAQAIIEQRKLLTTEPEARRDIAHMIGAIGAQPSAYNDDHVAFLAMNSARRRLQRATSEAAVDEVRDLLWDTALRIEDGALSIAERELRRLEQALIEALARDAPTHEIERLMNELQAALDRYLQAMVEQAMKSGQFAEGMESIESDMMSLSRDDLQRMLERARELSRTGARDAARELLSQLRSVLENLRAGVMSSAQRDSQRRGQQTLRELGDMMMRQQQLLDRSFQRSQPGAADRGLPAPSSDAGVQEALRRALGEIMRQLGERGAEIPEALGQAELSMRSARDALSRNQNGPAIGPQTEALEQLRQGAGQVMQGMMGDLGMEDGPGVGENDVDPLGRPMQNTGTDSGSDVTVPDKASLQKAREILDELHRRSGQRTRPEDELDYIDRLLRRF